MNSCYIALGSNEGNSEQTLRNALSELNNRGHLVRLVSRFHSSAPMGQNAGSEFLNAAAVIETQATPENFLKMLHEVEEQIGRKRSIRWGPRAIDLDLLLFEMEVRTTTQIQLPHPHLWYRRFVLEPLAEIAGDVIHPIHNCTVRDLLQRLNASPCVICVPEASDNELETARAALIEEFLPDSFTLVSTPASTSPTPFATVFKYDQTESNDPRTISLAKLPAGDDLVRGLRDILMAVAPISATR